MLDKAYANQGIMGSIQGGVNATSNKPRSITQKISDDLDISSAKANNIECRLAVLVDKLYGPKPANPTSSEAEITPASVVSGLNLKTERFHDQLDRIMRLVLELENVA